MIGTGINKRIQVQDIIDNQLPEFITSESPLTSMTLIARFRPRNEGKMRSPASWCSTLVDTSDAALAAIWAWREIECEERERAINPNQFL